MIIAGALTFKMAAQLFVDISEKEVNRMKENSISKSTKDAAKYELIPSKARYEHFANCNKKPL